MGSPIRVIWYTDPHNIWCWGFEPTVRRLEVRYPDKVEIETRQGGLFEDFSPVREQWARMSGGRWKDSVRTFFEAVSSQHRMPMNADAMLDSSDDFNSTWPACIAAKAADLQGPDQGWRYLRRLRQAWCLEGRGIHSKDVQTEVAMSPASTSTRSSRPSTTGPRTKRSSGTETNARRWALAVSRRSSFDETTRPSTWTDGGPGMRSRRS